MVSQVLNLKQQHFYYPVQRLKRAFMCSLCGQDRDYTLTEVGWKTGLWLPCTIITSQRNMKIKEIPPDTWRCWVLGTFSWFLGQQISAGVNPAEEQGTLTTTWNGRKRMHVHTHYIFLFIYLAYEYSPNANRADRPLSGRKKAGGTSLTSGGKKSRWRTQQIRTTMPKNSSPLLCTSVLSHDGKESKGGAGNRCSLTTLKRQIVSITPQRTSQQASLHWFIYDPTFVLSDLTEELWMWTRRTPHVVFLR